MLDLSLPLFEQIADTCGIHAAWLLVDGQDFAREQRDRRFLPRRHDHHGGRAGQRSLDEEARGNRYVDIVVHCQDHIDRVIRQELYGVDRTRVDAAKVDLRPRRQAGRRLKANSHAISGMPSPEIGHQIKDSEEQEQRDYRERTDLGLLRHTSPYLVSRRKEPIFESAPPRSLGGTAERSGWGSCGFDPPCRTR